MVIIPPPRLRERSHLHPVSRIGIKRLVEPRYDLTIITLQAMAARVGFEGIEILFFADHVLLVIIEHVGQGGQRLRCRKRPTRSAPHAPCGVDKKLRIPSLGHRRTILTEESLWVGQLPPRFFIATTGLRHIEIPWHKSKDLAHLDQFARLTGFRDRVVILVHRRHLVTHHFEELRLRIP